MEKLLTPFNKNHFFGYYDKSPLNIENKYLLSHNSKSAGSEAIKTSKVNICVTNLLTNETKVIDTTLAWNFQQGSQLQWLSKNKIIFNSYERQKYISKIFSIDNGKCEKKLKRPIYSISDDKTIYSSVNYSRLNKFRKGYGYIQTRYIDDNVLLEIRCLINDEILFSICKKDFDKYENIETCNIWVDHVIFSPNSKDFVFLLRSANKNSQLISYLFFFDYNKKKIINILNTGMAGHGAWIDSDNFIIWGRDSQLIKKITSFENPVIRKIIQSLRKLAIPAFIKKNIYGNGYIKFNKKNKKKEKLNFFIPMEISGGHFSFINKRYMISDTYHDQQDMCILFRYDLKLKKIRKIASFKTISNIKDTSFRCDLHPKIISNQELIIDSTHEGFRGVYKINI